jgi:6-pyruvoyltetrahydropterin/6-carboxytetrahydropterin synthase
MEIRKQFRFNGMHIVRNCSSERCKMSIHAHTYVVEVFLSADGLDNGMMCVDFGLLKGTMKDFISSFDKSFSVWNKESTDFKDFVSSTQSRIVTMPVSPSAEAYSYMLLKCISAIVQNTEFNNGEQNPTVQAVRVHETTSGYAETRIGSLTNLPEFTLTDINFSPAVTASWKDPDMWNKVLRSEKFINPIVTQQV